MKDPILFVRTMLHNTHLVLFYKNREYAMKIEFEFIKQGLEKGQKCYYTTQDRLFIKKKMSDFGIDVQDYMKEDLLHFIQIPVSFEEYADMIKDAVMSLSSSNVPIRLVSTHEFQFTRGRTVTMSKIEQFVDDNFAKLLGSMICTFPINKVDKKLRIKWSKDLLESHHAVLFAPLGKKGAAFRLP